MTHKSKRFLEDGLLLPRRLSLALAGTAALTALVLITAAAPNQPDGPAQGVNDDYVVFGYNDLGMHCMQDDFSELMILPPYNNFHAIVIRRIGGEPNVVEEGITVHYTIPSNTHSDDKTNFWRYAEQLFGVPIPPNIGLTGNGLSGFMSLTPNKDWQATGIPIVPIDDDGRVNPYQLATITVRNQPTQEVLAQTQAVMPVSTELTCHLCHGDATTSVGTDILTKHDTLHGTTLLDQRPVLCASCHADPALGAPGQPGISQFSSAMHTSHADRLAVLNLDNECYACHPGLRTQCQRDVHLANGMDCHSCHTSMEAVGSPTRTPWVDEPRCGDCHERHEFEFEESGRLFRESRGHHGVTCMACHGSPHAITPTLTDADNLQAITKQGHAGVIDQCIVCHAQLPDEPFEHKK